MRDLRLSRQRAATTILATGVVLLVVFSGCAGGSRAGVLRLGYFPNLTHAQALYGISTGAYQKALGDTKLETTVFNAGPAAFEALLSNRVDVIYVGPSPTISAIEKTGLDIIVVVAGSASGGAAFVLRPGLDISDDANLGGKRFASPQLGNTQDVALRHYLKDHGHTTKDRGGDVDVINPEKNADILTLFQQKQIDGAWVPEPWATRLVKELGGKVVVDESTLWDEGKFVTTHLVTTRAFFNQRGDEIKALVEANAAATAAVQGGSDEVLKAINDGLEKATGKPLPEDTLKAAMKNIQFTNDPLKDTFRKEYERSHDLGFAKKGPPNDLDRLYDLRYVPATAAASSG